MNPLFRTIPLVSSIAILANAIGSSIAAAAEPTQLKSFDPAQPQLRRLAVIEWLDGGALKLTGPLPSISKVWLKDNDDSPLEFGFNPDATEVTLYLPKLRAKAPKSPVLQFLITEKTTTHPDGVVVLSALDSQVIGEKAKLETHPGNHRIGFWGRAADFVRWDAAIPAGAYDVELVYSRASPTGTEVAISFDDAILPLKLETTGSWYRYRVVKLGMVKIGEADQHRVETRVTKIVNGGVMNLKALILTPKKRKG